MPTRYRERLAAETESHLVLTIDTEDTCLLLYPASEWVLIEQKIAQLPSFNPAARRIQRLLIGHATEIELDGSGRFLVPPLLRDYAMIQKRVMLVGQGKKFELWDETQWQSERERWLQAGVAGEETLPPELQAISL